MSLRPLTLALIAVTCGAAQPDRTVLVLGAHAGDAERLGNPGVEPFRARGYRIVNTALAGSGLNLAVDLTVATRRSQAQAEVARFIAANNPEIVITHSIGEANVVNHGAADLVYRAWQDARRKDGARLGQLWFRVPEDRGGMMSEAAFRRFFEPARQGDYFVVADAQAPAEAPAVLQPGPAPTYPSPGRRPLVMAIGTHADDVEWAFGGTFGKLIEQGWKGVYVVAINNTAGNRLDVLHPNQPKPEDFLNVQHVQGPFAADALETIQIRQEESRRAAAVYGATPEFLNLHETWFWLGRQEVYFYDPRWNAYDPPGTGVITSAAAGSKGLDQAVVLMKRYQPDVVLAMMLAAGNPEHGETGDVAYRAFVRAAREGAHVGQLWMGIVDPPRYLERVRIAPDISVDVTSQVDRVLTALEQHVSQGQRRADNQARLDRSRIGGRYYEHFMLLVDRKASK